jgi:hypothetical protein
MVLLWKEIGHSMSFGNQRLNILRQSFEISAYELIKCQNEISNKMLTHVGNNF